MTDNPHAARETSRAALVTCAKLPDLDRDDQLLVPALAARGVHAGAVVWDDPDVDWTGFDLAVLRSPWDYAARRDEFVAWAATVPRLANPADVVVWNTDKRYLSELADAGVPIVPTSWVAAQEVWELPGSGEWVVKPAISAGSKDTGRYQLGDPAHRRLAGEHVERLRADGRLVMIQPYLSAVDTDGETRLVFLAGADGSGLAFSHAIRKGPMLTGPDSGAGGLHMTVESSPRTPSDAELALATQVLAAVPGGAASLLYARVDVVPGRSGDPVLMELELTEPSLFLGHAPGAADRFAAAIYASI